MADVASTESVALVGTDARLVRVEVHRSLGLPSFTIVGLPTPSIREAVQRTRSAITSTGKNWYQHRLTANLAPANLRKEGTHFDLPIALGVLAATDELKPEVLDGWVIVGELALDGKIRPVRGALAAALAALAAGRRGVICAASNAPEAALVQGIEIVGVDSLGQCIEILEGDVAPAAVQPASTSELHGIDDLTEVRGQETAKRALEIAAAGAHNLLMVGPPGSGKTMLARRLPGIMPAMSIEESLEVTRIHSVAGLLVEHAHLVVHRPFRTPHHHVSVAGLIGGGTGIARPGEISLAHKGVLFLDELTLYKPSVLDALRGPLEDGAVRIARSGGAVRYPCRFSLIAAMNPCPCGFLGDSRRACKCPIFKLEHYLSRVSGPLLDRIDMQIGLTRVGRRELLGRPEGESSDIVRARVTEARERQTTRYDDPLATNAGVRKRILESSLNLQPEGRAQLALAVDALSLSGRGVDRVLRVARTIADLRGSESVDADDIAEALVFRGGGQTMEAA
jgi:magnesium chelatase family protein